MDMTEEEKKPTYFYRDPRLGMSVAGRFIVRLVSYGAYGALIIGALVLWSAQDVPQQHAIGSLIILFLLSRLIALHKPERSLSRLSPRHSNIAEYLAPETYRIIESAADKALLRGGDVKLYVLKELLKQPEIKQILIRLGVDLSAFSQKIEQYIKEAGVDKLTREQLQKEIAVLVEAAFLKGINNYGTAVKTYYLFGAFGELKDERIKRLFNLFSITSSDIEVAFLFGKGQRTSLRGFIHGPLRKRHRVMNRAWTARPTPTLDSFSVDITDVVREKGSWLMVGHKNEYERLLNVLSRPGNPHALLVGEPGSGKTTIVYSLAFQIIKDRVPPALFDHRLVALSMSALTAGADSVEISKRLEKIIEEIVAAGNVILCIQDIHELLKHDQGGRAGADILIPAIQNGDFSVIGGTAPKEFKQYIQPNNEFASSFEPIMVGELSEGETVQYLVYAGLVLETQSKITITFKAIKEAARIAHKYFRQKLLPSSAADLLKEALAGVALRHEKVLTPDDVIATAEQKVNIKMHAAKGEEVSQLLNLEKTIHGKFIDQEEAVKAVADALREYRAGVTRKGGPIASFLFCGPTGVGKTELSKILAETQFGDKNAMVRFDMTEYQDKQSFYRLIGSPDGVMRGVLTDAVLEKPYSLILLDEFEKAYPDILNLFLQVLDDGRLTDNLGRTVDFSNTIIIATSNAHSTLIKEELGKGTAILAITDVLKKRLTEYFKPELINRFSQVVVFKSLSQEDIVAVARLNLADLSATLSESQAVELKYDESAVLEIAKRGFDPIFGARPLRQAINENLRSKLADQLLREQIKKGDRITVFYRDGNFVFEK
jgi:ATP-dependent Clp protease ATP-binding subunit ClpC